MELWERLARWAERAGWFRLSDDYFLLPDGTIVSILDIEELISED